MSEAVGVRINNASNVRIVKSVEELKGLINTLVEKVTEDFVKKYQAEAKNYFFQDGEKDSIYYKLDVAGKIREKFKGDLESVPKGAAERKNSPTTTWYVNPPRFVKKKGQRLFWATRIIVEAEAYNFITPANYYGVSGPGTILPPIVTWSETPVVYSGTIQPPIVNWRETPVVYSGPSKELFAKGQSVFEVIWSVLITTTGKLTKGKIESIISVETTWKRVG
jgi:hypothetical protein